MTWLPVIATVIGILNGIVTLWIAIVVRRVEKLEDRVQCQAKEAIDGHFAAIADRCALKHQMIQQEMGNMNRRLEAGDGHFDTVDEQQKRMELALEARLGALKDFIRENCASRGDVEKLKDNVANLAGRFGAMERAVAMDIEAARKK